MTRILVVDDHPTQAEEFGDLLRNAGCDVTLAGNGQEAMDLVRLDLPDIVLTDLDHLLASLQEVETHDPQIAQGLRRLAEQFEYQKLLDLFGPGADPARSVVPHLPDGSAVLT